MNAVLASLCSWVPAFRFAPAGITHLAIKSENTTLQHTDMRLCENRNQGYSEQAPEIEERDGRPFTGSGFPPLCRSNDESVSINCIPLQREVKEQPMGQPASRMGDMHICPQVSILVPHVGGPIIMGSMNVFTGGQPQARVTDICICVGPPDAIALGSTTVYVNGLMAARIGDLTFHGGTIVGMCPTVLIGG